MFSHSGDQLTKLGFQMLAPYTLPTDSVDHAKDLLNGDKNFKQGIG